MKTKKLFVISTIIASLSMPAHAAVLLGFTSSGGSANNIYPPIVSVRFTVNNPITVTDLGWFDQNQDGFLSTPEVGIWNSGGTLLTSTTLPTGTIGTLVGRHRFAPITAIDLAPGQYWIGDQNANGVDPYLNFSTLVSSNPDVTWDFGDGTRRNGGVMPNFPGNLRSQFSGVFTYDGANFLSTAADNAIPEPSGTLALACLLGGGMMMRTRARRTL